MEGPTGVVRRHPKSKFTPDEDAKLNRLVLNFGSSDWNAIATFLPNRTPRQCRERWTKYLCPVNSFEPFLPEEDELLRRLHAQFGSKWVKISQCFRNRTDINVKNRWLVLMRQDRRVSPHVALSEGLPVANPPTDLLCDMEPLVKSEWPMDPAEFSFVMAFDFPCPAAFETSLAKSPFE
jgi:hypothetical protein